MFTVLKYLLRTNNQQSFLGALLDNRSDKEKENDIHVHDIVAYVNAVDWKEKTNIRKFPDYNQYNSYMCGANALSKYQGIAYSTSYGDFIPFSRIDIYQRRINKPEPGMRMDDMFKIASEGITLEQLTPKTVYEDKDADNYKIEDFKREVGKIFATSTGINVPINIDTIASVIQTTGKGVVLLTYFNSGEWSKEKPYIIDKSLTVYDGLRHFVVATDFTLINGVKYLVIEDSAWFGGINRRMLSEEWVNKRIYSAMYSMKFKFQKDTTNKPVYDSTSIISAQQCLRSEGLFPTNVSFINSFGPVTKKAVTDFQIRYNLPVTSQLDEATKNKLHQLYN